MSTFPEVRHISETIERLPDEVYAFASNPANLPTWAAGLSGAIRQVVDDWVAESPMGPVIVRFAASNDLGVMDHDVVLQSGLSVHNPFRVVPNGTGSEVIFTLFRRPEMSEKDFSDDAVVVQRDLQTLKRVLEAL